MTHGEDELVAWLRERLEADPRRVPIGIGDDAAAVRLDRPLVMITADMLLDTVHFDTDRHRLEDIGRKAIACSLSDCAAMACDPRAATVSVALSEGMTGDDVKRLSEGMAEIADAFGCALVGGDTTRWSGRLVIDVAMLAEPMSSRGPIRRSDGRPGDRLYISGTLGGSIEHKHLSFNPRLELAQQLVGEAALHALMDVSDGLAIDLHRMCRASGCDAELDRVAVGTVVSDAARKLSKQDGRTPLEHALSDGEDFELLVAADKDLEYEPLGLTPIGRLVERAGEHPAITLCGPMGEREPIEPNGYDHLV